MHILKASLLGLVALVTGSTPQLQLMGNWTQVYSNYFVQTTNEVDWGCVTVSVNKTTVTKFYQEHHNPNETRTVSFSSENYFSNLVVKGWSDNYVILTGTDNITMYVWARDYDTFMMNDNSGVISEAIAWDYTSEYKSLAPSFSEICLLENSIV